MMDQNFLEDQPCRSGLEREEGDGAQGEGTRNSVSRKQEACVQSTTRGQQARGWAGPQREGVGSGHLGQPGPSQSCELETLL